MHNKKLIGRSAAVVVAVALVGGTLAWFTDSEIATNMFKTGSVEVKIDETFTPVTDWTPGTVTNKDVTIENTGKSPAFIRVKLDKGWYDVNDTENKSKLDLDTTNIVPSILNEATTPTEDKWILGGDGYYYYIGIVGPNTSTAQLLDSVEFKNGTDDNQYAGLKLNVDVEVDAIQTTNKAYRDAWSGAPDEVLNMLDSLADVTAE